MNEPRPASENKMGTMPVGRLLFSMAVPMMVSMLFQALYNVVDSIFVARISRDALTAVSLAFPAQNLMIGLATGTAVGVNALMGRALGAKDQERANAVAINGVFLAVVGFAIFLFRTYAGFQLQVGGLAELQAAPGRQGGEQQAEQSGQFLVLHRCYSFSLSLVN